MAQSTKQIDVSCIYQSNRNRMVRFCQKRGLNLESAEDTTQEAFLRLLKSSATFADNKAATSYLFSAIRSMMIDRARSASERRAEKSNAVCERVLENTSDEAASASVSHELAVGTVTSFLTSYLSRTGDHIVEMHYQSGMTVGEISRTQKVAIGTITSHLCRFRRNEGETLRAAVVASEDLVYAQ